VGVLSCRSYPPPFDRHDWIVDRCGKEVRYIIDYYYNETVSDRDEKPELNSTDKIKVCSRTLSHQLHGC